MNHPSQLRPILGPDSTLPRITRRARSQASRRRNAGWGRALGFLVTLTLLSAVGRSSEPFSRFSRWQTEDGLPSNKIMALVQTRDGYMWIGTPEGLVRFDGVQFTKFDSDTVEALHDGSVSRLYEDRDGTLWIGHSSGAVTSLREGRFTAYPRRHDWKGSLIRDLAADAAGEIWVWDDVGDLARLRDGKVLHPAEGTAASVRQLSVSERGTIWLTSRGKLSVLEAGTLHVIPLDARMDNYVHGICASRDGGLWVVAHGGLWKWDGASWSREFGELSIGHTPLQVFIELADGRLVAGTSDHGAIVITPDPWVEQQLWRETGFPSDWVISLAQDHEGGLWLGTGGAGLFRSRHELVRTLAPPDAWQGRSVLSVAPARSGGYWIGTEGAGLYRFDGDTWTNYGREAGIRNPYIWTVAGEQEGRVWFGTWGGGLYRGGPSEFDPIPEFPPPANHIKASLPSASGGHWIGSHQGLAHYQHGVLRWVEPESDRQLQDVRAIVEQRDGGLWVGTHGHGLGFVSEGRVRRYTRRDGLPSDFIQSLHRDADGVLWIGTRGAGLVRLKDGRFATISRAQGLRDGSIGHIAEDRQGFLWMGSQGGILRVSKAQLDQCADGARDRVDCLSYGLSDGLLTLASVGGLQPSGYTCPDGTMIFATDRGLAVVDPGAVRINPHPPPVLIESIHADGRLIADSLLPGGTIELGPGARRIEVRYTGLSYAAPEKVRFRHRLSGSDEDWVDVNRERLAAYNYLPPGRYRFEVTACNNDNVWHREGATLAIVVRPNFWQTLWFRLGTLALLVAGTASLVWSQARRRHRRVLEVLERDHAIAQERARIANDMHDDLGANLTRITMLSEIARAEIADTDRLQKRLGLIYDTARSVTRAMDEIVWAVNPKHDTLESLVFYFEKFAQDLLSAAGMRCRLEMPAEFSGWKPNSEVRHNLFLAYKEALNNSVRHSGADTVTVALEMSGTGCRLTVSDNGCGLNGHGGAAGTDRIVARHGLASMRERLHRIGGTCEVGPAIDRGCVVTLFVPATPAQRFPPRDGPIV